MDYETALLIPDDKIRMLIESERLKTFENWPNDTSSWECTPEKLAKAGFYFHPCEESIDNVCCLFCQKELDGWDPTDDPLAEHKKHSPTCPFLQLRSPVEDLTVLEFKRLIQKITLLKTDKVFDKTKEAFELQSKESRKAIVDNVLHNKLM
ncbi:unnamed protein product [Lymnaea stagnalis]|uniref:Survivin n=1 Tax=Lymnaea stagnalis TaxID=6523 RepID=A0AAV2I9B2_LYMST